jgi:preprotein translocase subunit SecD
MRKFLIIFEFLLGSAIFGHGQEIVLNDYNWVDGFYKIYEPKRIDSVLLIQDKNGNKYYQIDSFPSVKIDKIKNFFLDEGKNKDRKEIRIEFGGWGTQQFKKLTEEMEGEKLGFVLDNELVFAPTVFGVIPDGVVSVFLDKTKKELEAIIEKVKNKLNKEGQ